MNSSPGKKRNIKNASLNAGFQELYNTQSSINKDRQREPQNLEDSLYALMQNMAH
jgi:hypothetical protein